MAHDFWFQGEPCGYEYSLRINGLTNTMNTQKQPRPLLELKTVNQVPSGYEFSLRMAGLTSNMNIQKNIQEH